MKGITKLAVASICLLCVHVVYAQNSSGSCAPACPPKECPKPCPPKPCPPKPCKPCPPVCFERGYPDTNCCIKSAYNEPADYELSPCPWNFWVDASFTYWTAYEEGLTLARSNATYTAAPVETASVRTALFQDTKWEPGFKIGLGADLGHDHWSAFAEYTWFRSRTTTSAAAPEGPAGTTDPVWDINNWELDNFFNASHITSVWRLRMDLLDVGVTRPYYQGTHLIVAPFGGIRAEWIRQNLRIHPTPFDPLFAVNTNAVFHNQSYAWGVGPRGGFQGKWHLGWGFRIEGDMAGSIVFTRYTKVTDRADPVDDGLDRPNIAHYGDYNTVRFNNEMNIGLGWGDYFDCRNYHFDLLVTYDFQIFWNQNMMRMLVDEFDESPSASAHNLYLQGVTVKAQFDF
ncbi:MAG: hypothetical protein K1X28_03850 [Parachlamydiales bacterium]|nr:hypothetical protein [Parachlamydiales bacterium]